MYKAQGLRSYVALLHLDRQISQIFTFTSKTLDWNQLEPRLNKELKIIVIQEKLKKNQIDLLKDNNVLKIAGGGITAPGTQLSPVKELLSDFFAQYPEELHRINHNKGVGETRTKTLSNSPEFQFRVFEYSRFQKTNRVEVVSSTPTAEDNLVRENLDLQNQLTRAEQRAEHFKWLYESGKKQKDLVQRSLDGTSSQRDHLSTQNGKLEHRVIDLEQGLLRERQDCALVRLENFDLREISTKTAAKLEELSSQNPYLGVSSPKSWKHMAQLRVKIDGAKPFLTAEEKAADLQERWLFLNYAVRDVWKIYINTTTQSSVGEHLPQLFSSKLPDWTASIIPAMGQIFDTFVAAGGGP